jgi:hypothetical protein
MRRAKYVVPVLLALTAVLALAGWLRHRALQPMELTLYFHPFVGSEPLALGTSRYANPGGDGRFAVRSFQFYLSNIRLAGDSGAYAEPDSYHLVRFDGAEPTYGIVLRGVPRRKYRRLEFGLGVDPAANRSLAQRGDLDPNGRMAWAWEVGYKFVLVEGTLARGEDGVPIVYHVGFDENYAVISTELPQGSFEDGAARFDFRVDLLQLFGGSPAVDMAALPTVKFDRGDAARLGRNFAAMITPLGADPP